MPGRVNVNRKRLNFHDGGDASLENSDNVPPKVNDLVKRIDSGGSDGR
jgi:hypothetical protein